MSNSVRKKSSQKLRRRIGMVISYTLLGILTLVFVLPIAFMLVSSLKGSDAIFADLRSWRAFLPVGDLSFDNIQYVFARGNFQRYAVNSVIITLVTATLSVMVNSMSAFALARLNWPGKRLVFAFVIAILIIPFEAIAIPLLMLVSEVPGLHIGLDGIFMTDSMFNTHLVQILPFVASPFTLFLFYQFFRDLPTELDEAARLDGATAFQIYWKIVMPLSKPVLATVAIFGFVFYWNYFLNPLIYLGDSDMFPLALGINFLRSFRSNGEIATQMAGSVMFVAPCIVLYLVAQRYITEGIVTTGLKG